MKKIISAMLFSVFSVSAAAADHGYYVSVDSGRVTFSHAEDVLRGTLPDTPGFSKAATTRVGGGFHFNEYMGVDIGYLMNQDSISDSFLIKQTLKSSSFLIAAVGAYPVNEAFELFGKLGLANNRLTYSAPFQTQVSGLVYGSATKTSMMFGLGAQYNINKQWSIRVQYENLGKTNLTASISLGGAMPGANIGMSAITVGNVYSF